MLQSIVSGFWPPNSIFSHAQIGKSQRALLLVCACVCVCVCVCVGFFCLICLICLLHCLFVGWLIVLLFDFVFVSLRMSFCIFACLFVRVFECF